MYIQKRQDYSAESLHYIFLKHIDKKANVVTDKWRGYRPIAKEYDITQIESNNGANFKVLHTIIQ